MVCHNEFLLKFLKVGLEAKRKFAYKKALSAKKRA
jgi:hypothetical protein